MLATLIKGIGGEKNEHQHLALDKEINKTKKTFVRNVHCKQLNPIFWAREKQTITFVGVRCTKTVFLCKITLYPMICLCFEARIKTHLTTVKNNPICLIHESTFNYFAFVLNCFGYAYLFIEAHRNG